VLDANTFKRAQIATALAFFLNGFGQGTFISRIPDLKHQLGISNSVLGGALFLGAAGVLSSLQLSGWLCAKYGSGPVTRILNFTLVLTLPLIALNINLVAFCIALYLNGFIYAAQDIAMNAHGSTLEVNSTKRIMSRLHALWSIGALTGGAIGGIATQLKTSPLTHFTSIVTITLLISIFLRNRYLKGEIDKHALEHREKHKRPRIFFILGLLGLCGAIGEGAASDWGGILIRDTFNASGFLIALPYVLFCTTMVTGRLSGDYLAHKFGTRNLITFTGLIAGFGLALGLLIGGQVGVLIAWFILGAGISVNIPMMFSSAGTIADKEFKNIISGGEAIAIVSGITYFGFVFGPPMMGAISDQIGLRWAMMIPAGLAILLAFGARRVLTTSSS
jgi:MFS family permease